MRIVWIERQIEVLARRCIMVRIGNTRQDYYKYLQDLQNRLDEQMLLNRNYERQLKEKNERIRDL